MFTNTKQQATDFAKQFEIELPVRRIESDIKRDAASTEALKKKVRQRVSAFQKTARLGIVRRIIFSRILQRELRALGYDAEILRLIMVEVMVALSFKS